MPNGLGIKTTFTSTGTARVDSARTFTDQEGSASMKTVLPALTGRGYEHLAIQEGATASLEFLRVTFGEVAEQERQRVRRQLEENCGQDR